MIDGPSFHLQVVEPFTYLVRIDIPNLCALMVIGKSLDTPSRGFNVRLTQSTSLQ